MAWLTTTLSCASKFATAAGCFCFDAYGRLLCWFQIAPNDVLLGWGNFYDGAISEHYYGSAAKLGEAHLPRFGASSTGSMRFEYLSARFTDQAPVEPDPPRANPLENGWTATYLQRHGRWLRLLHTQQGSSVRGVHVATRNWSAQIMGTP